VRYRLSRNAHGHSIYSERGIQDYRNLEVWKQAHLIVLDVYRLTSTYPKEQLYGLVFQTRRAAASVPTNIAEGCGRGSDADFGRFLQIALGSATELDYHLLLARDLGYIDQTALTSLSPNLDRVRKMLNAFLKRLKT
jgi:four helix bundle protein